MSVSLRPFTLDDEAVVMAAHADFRDDPYIDFLVDYRDDEPFEVWLGRVASYARGEDLPEDWVRASFLAVEVDGAIAGRMSIRYDLNDYLRRYGGHIGNAELAQYRGRGVATEALRQALTILFDSGLQRVLISCEDTNAASARVIEKVGGFYDGTVTREDGSLVRRYWVSRAAGEHRR